MPLSAFQKSVFAVIARNRSPDSYVAGATIIQREADSPRYSRDVDLFHDAAEDVAASAQLDAAALTKAGYEVAFSLQQAGFQRAIVSRDGQSLRLEWATDSAFRFFPLVPDPQLGFRLHDADAATNKVLAAASRDKVRDIVDLLYLNRTYIPLGIAIWAACGKDEGLTPELILEQLKRNSRINPASLEGLDLAQPLDPQAIKTEWLAALDHAQSAMKTLPPLTLGFLFLDKKNGNPVRNSVPPSDWVAHRGSVKGAWPRLVT
jgi:hypothetical protein